jgi:hypothetical protein
MVRVTLVPPQGGSARPIRRKNCVRNILKWKFCARTFAQIFFKRKFGTKTAWVWLCKVCIKMAQVTRTVFVLRNLFSSSTGESVFISLALKQKIVKYLF